jgi:chromosome partitioning protein
MFACYTVRVLTIVMASQKGGSGKTTTCLSLAVAAQQAGERVLVLDTDPQKSALEWGEVRDREPFVRYVATDAPTAVSEALKTARSEAYSVVFVDTAPRASASLFHVVAACDGVIVPVRPSTLDIGTVEQTKAIVEAAGKPFAFVVNEAPARAPEIAEARAILAEIGPVLDTVIGQRRAYGRAIADGSTAAEAPKFLGRPSDATREVAALWAEVARRFHANP